MRFIFSHVSARIVTAGLLVAGVGVHAWAATLTVTSIADTGAGTLRQAVADANTGDTIQFSLAYPATIFVGPTIAVTQSLTILGPGAGNLALDGYLYGQPMLQLSDSATLTLGNITMQNSGMAAIRNLAGTLLIDHSVFFQNNSPGGGAIVNGSSLTVSNSSFNSNQSTNQGGAIYNTAGATVIDCSFTGNYAVHDGGAILNTGGIDIENSTFSINKSTGNFGGTGGAILNKGTLVLDNSTFSANSTSGSGGALFNQGSATITSSTFSGNLAPAAGSAILNYDSVAISRSIIDGSCTGGSLLASSGDNLGTDDSCFPTSTTLNDRTFAHPQLLALASNGGPTQTMALPAASPAIDQVMVNDATCAGKDQRGYVRPVGAHCDIGSVEMDFDFIFGDGFE